MGLVVTLVKRSWSEVKSPSRLSRST
uniref:TIDP3705 n=1 Tax=Arundo donax TaxID=35708 RepID=A0A0A9FHJ5_ARUDO